MVSPNTTSKAKKNQQDDCDPAPLIECNHRTRGKDPRITARRREEYQYKSRACVEATRPSLSEVRMDKNGLDPSPRKCKMGAFYAVARSETSRFRMRCL